MSTHKKNEVEVAMVEHYLVGNSLKLPQHGKIERLIIQYTRNTNRTVYNMNARALTLLLVTSLKSSAAFVPSSSSSAASALASRRHCNLGAYTNLQSGKSCL